MGEGEKGCLFCNRLSENRDVENLILFRGELNFVIMNLYPYNPGHLMVAPYEHLSELDELDLDATMEMMELTRKCIRILKEKMSPQGLNVGFNLGEIAGASIKEHIHIHIVPRWQGDNNFMPVLSDIRVVPQSLAETYQVLIPSFDKL